MTAILRKAYPKSENGMEAAIDDATQFIKENWGRAPDDRYIRENNIILEVK